MRLLSADGASGTRAKATDSFLTRSSISYIFPPHLKEAHGLAHRAYAYLATLLPCLPLILALSIFHNPTT